MWGEGPCVQGKATLPHGQDELGSHASERFGLVDIARL
jgi:hypothetical protein